MNHLKTRLIAISVSFTVSLALLALKFYAFWLTDSSAILSDALESIINVVASGFALGCILFSARPPDQCHPYGHSKIEYFSAGFEGSLIILAAMGILYRAGPQILYPRTLPNLQDGLLIVLGASLINLILGIGLVKVGKRTHSLVLVADGKHLLTDVFTSVGVIGGLGLVLWTGWHWLDGAVACLVALNILVTGGKLVRQSFAGLMDASDPYLLEEIASILREHRKSIWIDIHRLRARRSGNRIHIDFHLILPRDLDLEEGHKEVKDLERIFAAHLGGLAEDVLIHVDPCTDHECPICGYDPCKHRQEDIQQQRRWQREELVGEAPGDQRKINLKEGE
jgi:cation diffusion facilitator family transporter